MVLIGTNRDKIYKTQMDILDENMIKIAFESIPDNPHSRYVADYTLKHYALLIAETNLRNSFDNHHTKEERTILFEKYQKALEEKLEEDEEINYDD